MSRCFPDIKISQKVILLFLEEMIFFSFPIGENFFAYYHIISDGNTLFDISLYIAIDIKYSDRTTCSIIRLNDLQILTCFDRPRDACIT